jgi:hypothetical protein
MGSEHPKSFANARSVSQEPSPGLARIRRDARARCAGHIVVGAKLELDLEVLTPLEV